MRVVIVAKLSGKSCPRLRLYVASELPHHSLKAGKTAVELRCDSYLGLISGGPTFLGTILGISFHSTELFIFCLAFAAEAIVNVVMELLSSTRRYSRETVVWGLFVGFLLGLGTDLILTVAGT